MRTGKFEPQQSPVKRCRKLMDVKPKQATTHLGRSLDDSGFSDCSLRSYRVHSTPDHSQFPSPNPQQKAVPPKRSYQELVSPQKPIKLPWALQGMREFGSPTKLWVGLCESGDDTLTPQYARHGHKVLDNEDYITARLMIYENLLTISSELNLHRETFHLAMDIVDRYITRVDLIESIVDICGLIGLAALHIAGKVEEFQTPRLNVVLACCATHQSEWAKHNPSSILKMETEMLQQLDFHCTPMTAIQWLALFLQLVAVEEEAEEPPRKRISLSPHHTSMSSQFTQDSGFTDLSTSPSTDISGFDNHFEIHRAKTREFAVPKFMRHEFIKLASILDISMTDKEYLFHSYRRLAASVIFLNFENTELSEEITGFTYSEIQSTLNFIEPYFEAITPEFYNLSIMAPNEQNNGTTPTTLVFSSCSPSKRESYDKHNIQPMHEDAVEIILKALEFKSKKEAQQDTENVDKSGKNNKKNLFGKATTPRKILSPRKAN